MNIGKLHGIFAVFEDIALLCGTLIFNTLYPMTRPIFSGLMFLVGAGLLLIPAILLPFIKMNPSEEKHDEPARPGQDNNGYVME